MGCDIHIVVERKKRNAPAAKWIGVYLTDSLPMWGRPRIAQRDYGFFAEVANVRGSTKSGLYPRNLPEDVSPLAWESYMQAPRDHHSVSHLTAREFVDAWFRVNPEIPVADEDRKFPPEPRHKYGVDDLLGVDEDDERFEYRVVFWFDN